MYEIPVRVFELFSVPLWPAFSFLFCPSFLTLSLYLTISILRAQFFSTVVRPIIPHTSIHSPPSLSLPLFQLSHLSCPLLLFPLLNSYSHCIYRFLSLHPSPPLPLSHLVTALFPFVGIFGVLYSHTPSLSLLFRCLFLSFIHSSSLSLNLCLSIIHSLISVFMFISHSLSPPLSIDLFLSVTHSLTSVYFSPSHSFLSLYLSLSLTLSPSLDIPHKVKMFAQPFRQKRTVYTSIYRGVL